MKIFILLLFCFPLFGQVNIVQWEKDGITYQDAILGNKLEVSGKIYNLRCMNCNFEIVSNGSIIKELGKPIRSNKELYLSEDGKETYYNLLGQKIAKPSEPGWYFIHRGNIAHEIYIDDWGHFGPINGGL